MPYATQYRPGFITIDEPLDRDVPVASLEEARKLPWVKRWIDTAESVYLADDMLMAQCSDGKRWVVGYYTPDTIYCTEHEMWKTHCRSQHGTTDPVYGPV